MVYEERGTPCSMPYHRLAHQELNHQESPKEILFVSKGPCVFLAAKTCGPHSYQIATHASLLKGTRDKMGFIYVWFSCLHPWWPMSASMGEDSLLGACVTLASTHWWCSPMLFFSPDAVMKNLTVFVAMLVSNSFWSFFWIRMPLVGTLKMTAGGGLLNQKQAYFPKKNVCFWQAHHGQDCGKLISGGCMVDVGRNFYTATRHCDRFPFQLIFPEGCFIPILEKKLSAWRFVHRCT